MKTIKLSHIKHVRDVKFDEGIKGGAYYDVIKDGKKVQIYPYVPGFGLHSAAVYHDGGKVDVVVDDVYYEGYHTDAGPQVSFSSEARPATELYEQLGFAIDVEA
jgi:hypothetical protein